MFDFWSKDFFTALKLTSKKIVAKPNANFAKSPVIPVISCMFHESNTTWIIDNEPPVHSKKSGNI